MSRAARVVPTAMQVFQAFGGEEELRRTCVAVFRRRGGDLDRWRRVDWELMAGALTSCEDELELVNDRTRACFAKTERETVRGRLRVVRRALEVVSDD